MSKPNKNKTYRSLFLLLFCILMFVALYGCGPGPDSTTPPGPTIPTTAYLDLSASPTTVKSDNSNTSTITVTALNSSHATLSGMTVAMSAASGNLGAAILTTDATGKATVTFSSGSSNRSNRTVTISAISGSASAQIPIQIVGSTITLESTGTSLPDDGTSPVTITVTAKDAGGNLVPSAAVTVEKISGAGNVSITPASGDTISDGTFTATVAGTGAGNVTLRATALGTTATKALTISASGATFAIDQQTLCNPGCAVIANNKTTAMNIGDSLQVRVHTPASITNVTFATTIGVWDGSTSTITKAVVAQQVTATLTTTQAGVASIQVYNTASPSTNDTLTVPMTSAAVAYRIDLQAIPTTVPKSVGSTTGSSTLTATVRDNLGNPIGNSPVAFSIINPTSGGETVSPVVVLTAATTSAGLSLGEARTTFTSGSLSSGGDGIHIRASVVGTAVETEPVGVNLTPSGNDARIIIGGTAGSIAFGQATVLGLNSNATAYILAMSVLVADSGGNPVVGQQVSLSAWPIAWSTGVGAACAYDADDGINQGTFFNEDINENLILDAGEDGARIYAASGLAASAAGTIDTHLTPTNSAGGTVPAIVTTDASGLATFNLTYLKSSAIWTVTRIRASTIVQGSETAGQIIFRLAALQSDVGPPCLLEVPYVF